MGVVDVVGVLRAAVTGAPQIAYDIPGLHHAAHLQAGLVGVILAQMGVIVVAFVVKAAYSQPPSAILVPAQGFHIAGFHGNHRSPHLAHHVVAQVLTLEAIAAGHAEVVKIAVGKSFGDGGKCLESVFCHPDRGGISGGSPCHA